MPEGKGKFVWCELMTTDAAKAIAFYTEVIGWTATDSGVPGAQYTILNAGAAPMGGVVEMPQSIIDAGATPGWIGYVGVDDVDGYAARLVAAGGRVHHGPDDIPTVGRFAIVTDPQGARFTLFAPLNTSMAPPPAGMMEPGRVGWHELRATEWEAEFAFYAGMFGWTKDRAIDMGPMGVYQLFAIDGVQAGGMMTHPGERPDWLYYFNVPDIGAAEARVKAAGGSVTQGPHEVPGGAWILHCLDPLGVKFAVVAPGPAA